MKSNENLREYENRLAALQKKKQIDLIRKNIKDNADEEKASAKN